MITNMPTSAIKYLEAVTVVDRYAFLLYPKRARTEDNPYYIATEQQLRALISGNYQDPDDARFLNRPMWLREERIVKIRAAWWTPEHQFARFRLHTLVGWQLDKTAATREECGVTVGGWKIVTLNLQTGEEHMI